MAIRHTALLLLILTSAAYAGPKPRREPKGQKVPTPQRVAEIQTALQSHGFTPGKTWVETQEICRHIADQHLWQTDHAPDARVLILIGLGNAHSNPEVAAANGGHLDEAQRAEAERKKSGRADD